MNIRGLGNFAEHLTSSGMQRRHAGHVFQRCSINSRCQDVTCKCERLQESVKGGLFYRKIRAPEWCPKDGAALGGIFELRPLSCRANTSEANYLEHVISSELAEGSRTSEPTLGGFMSTANAQIFAEAHEPLEKLVDVASKC